jgi:Tol biopolymer transport system component
MKSCHRLLVLSLVVVVAVTAALGASGEGTRRVRFTTHEGSWLSFDVSPDGRWIAFDLLGQLWTLPIEGGVARPITDAVGDSAEFLDPVIAPDGRSVMAHGEFRGRIAIVATPADSGKTRFIAPDVPVRGTGLAFHSPVWSRGGSHLLVARPDTGAGLTLVEREIRTGAQRVVNLPGLPPGEVESPAYSPDGRTIYFSAIPRNAGTYPGAGRIWRVGADGGTPAPFSPADRLARAAAPSPDGRAVAYLVIDSTNITQVWVQGVADSVGTPVTDEPEVAPTRVRWLPGSDALVYTARGRLWRLDLATRARREIPFSATIDFQRREAALAPIRFPAPGEDRAVTYASGYALSPDARSVAIIALSRLWIAPVAPGARAHEIVSVPAQSAAPEWSPDGRHILWWAGPVWDEQLFVTDTVTRSTRRLLALPGFERNGTWSPDGRRVAYASATTDSGGRLVIRLRAVAVADTSVSVPGATQDLGPLGSPWPEGAPQWSPRGDAVLMVEQPGNRRARGASLRFLDGSAVRAVSGIPADAIWVRWLPGDTLAFVRDFRVWKAPFDPAAGRVGAAQPVADGPMGIRAASRSGAVLAIGPDGLRLLRSDGPAVAIGRPVHYTVPARPSLLVHNVRIIDGTGTPASAPRDILVRDGRIARIAAAGTLRAPAGASVLDGEGRVAIPGLIDLHAHHQTAAALRGQLYFGVTTMRRLGGAYQGWAENVASGTWLGPRLVEGMMAVLTDEPPLWQEEPSAATEHEDTTRLGRVLALATAAGTGLVKIHSVFGWALMNRTVELAHQRGTRVTGHCGYPLTLVAAGIDAKEHLGWQCSVHDGGIWYDDLVQLYARSGVAIVPTRALFSNSHRTRGAPQPPTPEVAALFGPTELREVTNRSLSFASRITPGNAADLRNQTDALGKLRRAGVLLGAGSDFERPDGMQYELEALVEASLTPLEAIAAATGNAARIMGAQAEIGRIAPGLLADIVLLDADPTVDIRNARQVWAVIQGGRVVDRQALVRSAWDAAASRR